jgi:TatA/E family protein of Tat protein translocase
MLFALIGPVGWNELVIILVIVLVVFGPRRLPELAEAFGKSIRKFKHATREVEEEVTKAVTKDENKKDG